LSYRGFLKLNRDIIIASLNSITSSSSLTLDKWENFDITWKKRFLENAKILLGLDTFIELKKKVCLFLFCKVWVTPNTQRSHLVRITVLTPLVTTPSSQLRRPTLLLIKSANSGGGIGYVPSFITK
jgi:hypothetical protein